MKKQEKTFFVDNLTEELKTAKSAILVDYSGLDMATQQELKKRLEGAGASMVVVKNTLLKLAGEKAKLPKESTEDSVLSGQTALVLANDDPISPIGILAKFAEEFNVPQMKIGVIEGSFQDKTALDTLSKLPGKNALFAQVVGGISAPLYGIVGTLQANLQKLVYILDQATKKGGDN